jgi:hypothetical protein
MTRGCERFFGWNNDANRRHHPLRRRRKVNPEEGWKMTQRLVSRVPGWRRPMLVGCGSGRCHHKEQFAKRQQELQAAAWNHHVTSS